MEAAPVPVDITDFHFKQHCRLKVFNSNLNNDTFNYVCHLVDCASRYGLVFVGSNNNQFQVIRIEDIESLDKSDTAYPGRIVNLSSKPLHISVNCDSTKLAVVLEKNGVAVAKIYDVLSFLKQEVKILHEIRLSATQSVVAASIAWNPALPDIFTAAKSDGSLGVYEFKQNAFEVNELPSASATTCFCWSPKGKQIAVGSQDGKITQYRPDLKAVKFVNPPPMACNATLISLQWTSSFQFIGIYKDNNPEGQSYLIVINAPKTGNPNYINYEDICYSYGNRRPQQFYIILEQHWNMLIVASSNSMEVSVMYLEENRWIQWNLGDSSRAELPLSASKQDTQPIGVAFCTGTTKYKGEGTNSVAPMLFLLSNDGFLCSYHTINARNGALSSTSPPEPVADRSGLSSFKINNLMASAVVSQPVVVPPAPQPVAQPLPAPIPQQPSFLPPAYTSTPAAVPQPILQKPLLVPPRSFPSFSSTPVPTAASLPAFSKVSPSAQSFFANETPPKSPLLNTPSVPQFAQQAQTLPKAPLLTETPTPAVSAAPATPKTLTKNDRMPVNKETDAMIAQVIREEYAALDLELKILAERAKSIVTDIGTDDEASQIASKVNALEDFVNVLKETSTGQASEVHTLKQNLMESWVMYEDAQSRFKLTQDPFMIGLLQSQPLDSASQSQQDEINRMSYYIESQLTQANKALDEQWETFQDSLSKNVKVRVPTMELIYQSIKKQTSTLQKQKYILKYIASRINSQKRAASAPSIIPLNKIEDIELELSKLQLNVSTNLVALAHQETFKKQRKLTQNKTQKLHNFLVNREVTHVSPSKPDLNNSTLTLSSLLAAPISPIAPNKKMQPVKLEFVMSTPKVGGMFPETGKVAALLQKPIGVTSNASSLFNIPSNAEKPASIPFGNKFVQPQEKPIAKSIFALPATTVQAVVTTAPTSIFANTSSAFGTANTSSAFGTANTSATFSIASLLNAPSMKTTVAATKPNQATETIKSIFGSPPAASPFGNKHIFAAAPTSTTVPSSTKSITTATVTAKPAAVTVVSFSNMPPATANIFSSAKVTAAPTETSVSSTKTILSVPSPPPPTTLFTNPVSSTSGSLFTTTPFGTGALFGLPSAPPTTSSIFLSSTPPTTTGIFGAVSNQQKVVTTAGAVAGTCLLPTPTSIVSTSGVVPTPAKTEPSPVTVSAAPFTLSVTTIPSAVATSTVTTQVSKSSFTSPPSTSAGAGIFGSVTSTTPSTTTAPSIFGAPPAPAPHVAVTSTTTSIFSTPATTSSIFGGQTSIFAVPATSSTTPTTETTKPFGFSTSVFGGVTSTAPTVSTTTTASIFASTPTTQTSIFSGATAAVVTTAASSSIFGSSATPTTSIFGNVPKTTSSAFGFAAASGNKFGFNSVSSTTPTTTNTTQSSIFGTPVSSAAPTTTAPASAFGASSIFAAPASTAVTTTSTFASSPFGTTTNASASPFASTTSQSGSIFGKPAAFGSGSIFGGVAGSESSSSSIFGGSSTPSSIFGSTPVTSTNVFGSPTTSSNVFGNTTTTTSSIFGGGTSVFGSTPATNSAFGSASGFGTTTSPFGAVSTSANTPFGQQQQPQQQSSFGGTFANAANPTSFFSNLSMGNTPTTSATGFGSNFGQPPANPFGRTTTAPEQKSPFNTGSIFGSPSTTQTSSVFGGSSPFNKQAPAFGSAPAFGASPAFGSQPPAFGQNSSFGSTSFGSPAQGSFSAGGQSVQQSGFGGAFQKPATGGFGAAPVFGSASSFGNPPAFGSAASFGAAPSFGSPPKVFGGTSGIENNAFGNVNQNSTFGNLANQNTLGFGNLAQQTSTPPQQQQQQQQPQQQQQQQQQASFSGGSSFSSWR